MLDKAKFDHLLENRDAWFEAQIAECERVLATLPEDDFLGRIGFNHRLAIVKEGYEIYRKAKPEVGEPNYSASRPEDFVGSGAGRGS